MHGGHLGGAERRRHRRDERPLTRRARRRQRLCRVHDAAAAERDDQLARIDLAEQRARDLVDAARRNVVDGARTLGERRRQRACARRRQQRESLAERGQRGVERVATEVDRALAVLPGEARPCDLPISSRPRGPAQAARRAG
jgi:hypothetical protein